MKKRVITLTLIFSFICLSIFAFNSYCSADNNNLQEQIKNFTEKYGKDVKIHYDNTGRPTRVRRIKTAASDEKPEDIALSFLSANQSFLGIDLTNLKFRKCKETKDLMRVIFQQFYKGVLVQDNDVRVNVTKNGEITFIKSRYYPHDDLDIIPKITPEKAAVVIKEDLGISELVNVKTNFAEDGIAEKEFLPVVPGLIIIPEGGGQGAPRLGI